MATVKVGDIKIKCFDITPDKKYMVILPEYLWEQDQNVVKAIVELFQDVESVTLIMKKPEDVKIIGMKKHVSRKNRKAKDTDTKDTK